MWYLWKGERTCVFTSNLIYVTLSDGVKTSQEKQIRTVFVSNSLKTNIITIFDQHVTEADQSKT